MKIYAQKNGSFTKAELLELSTLLIKGGYTVKRGVERSADGKKNIDTVEFWGDSDKEEDYA